MCNSVHYKKLSIPRLLLIDTEMDKDTVNALTDCVQHTVDKRYMNLSNRQECLWILRDLVERGVRYGYVGLAAHNTNICANTETLTDHKFTRLLRGLFPPSADPFVTPGAMDLFACALDPAQNPVLVAFSLQMGEIPVYFSTTITGTQSDWLMEGKLVHGRRCANVPVRDVSVLYLEPEKVRTHTFAFNVVGNEAAKKKKDAEAREKIRWDKLTPTEQQAKIDEKNRVAADKKAQATAIAKYIIDNFQLLSADALKRFMDGFFGRP